MTPAQFFILNGVEAKAHKSTPKVEEGSIGDLVAMSQMRAQG